MTDKEAREYIIRNEFEDDDGYRAFVDGDDEAWAMYTAAKALERVDKYRWHDLRKNHDDLPTIEKEVYVCYISHPNAYGEQKKRYGKDTYTYMCNNRDGSKFCTFKKGNRVIAWKEIEPFEVDE